MPDDPQKGREKTSYSKNEPLFKPIPAPNQKLPKSFADKDGRN